MTLTELFKNIADAIREKKGTTESIVAEDFPEEIESITGGENPLDYFTGLSHGGGTVSTMFPPKLIKKIPNNIPVQETNLASTFRNCINLEEVGTIDTTGVINMNSMFHGCSSLITVPVFNTASVNVSGQTGSSGFDNMFNGCTSLSNASLNNILKMCINATSYQGTKTLAEIGLTSSQATTCQGLSNYADFVAAGWSTGY